MSPPSWRVVFRKACFLTLNILVCTIISNASGQTEQNPPPPWTLGTYYRRTISQRRRSATTTYQGSGPTQYISVSYTHLTLPTKA